MDTSMNMPSATPETVWALLRELAERQAENDRQRQEYDRILSEKQAETDRQIKQAGQQISTMQAETDKQIKQIGQQISGMQAETARQIKKVNETLGSWANNHGLFAEEYFFNSFDKGKQNFFHEKFDEIKKNLKGTETEDEFDIVMLNGSSVGLIEVKFKAHENDLPKMLKKVNSFRDNFPKYKNHKIYLGLASMSFYPALEDACKKQGIAIIKQVGDTVVIQDEHLKAF